MFLFTRTADSNNLRFPGQYADAETSLHQNWYRNYSSALGRYLEPDPFGQSGSLNLYGYASQRPTRAVDPTGRMSVDATCETGRCPECVSRIKDAAKAYDRLWLPGWKDRKPNCRDILQLLDKYTPKTFFGNKPSECMSNNGPRMVIKCDKVQDFCGGPATLLLANNNVVWLHAGGCDNNRCGTILSTIVHEASHNCGAPDETHETRGWVAQNIGNACE